MLIAQNEITNPAVAATFGTGATNTALTNVIATVWRTAITLGGLALLVMLIMGALNWVTSGGDKSKVEAARERMTQAVIGMLVLVGTVAISAFIGAMLGINLLQPNFADNLNGAGGNVVTPCIPRPGAPCPLP
jgi:hypothetical protein